MSQTFLSAEWRKLAILNYAADPASLKPFLPAHTELDVWNGVCYASMVGFLFANTRVLGVKIPFHVNFEEVNLRFYVKHQTPQGEWRRGVVFVRELVPKPAIAWVANSLYRERYSALPMRHSWVQETDKLSVEYSWKYKGHWNHLGVRANAQAIPLKAGSEAEFITEHYWGYARWNDTQTMQYQVEHPRWELYPVDQWRADINFSAQYGPSFAYLNKAEPLSVFLAEGSEVSIKKGERIF